MQRTAIFAFLLTALGFADITVQAKQARNDVPPPPEIARKHEPILEVPPQYPPTALERRQYGWVLVEFTITAEGRVRRPRIVKSSHRVFERAALRAVLRWRYRPTIVDGVAVPVQGVREVIVFDIEEHRTRVAETRRVTSERSIVAQEWREARKRRILQPDGTPVSLPSGRKLSVLGPWVMSVTRLDPSALRKPDLSSEDYSTRREFRCHVLLNPESLSEEEAAEIAEELMQVYIEKELQKLGPDKKGPVHFGTVRFVPLRPEDFIPRKRFADFLQFRFEQTRTGRWRMVK